MPTQRKIEIVEELRDRIERSVIAIATEYRGLSATEMVQLRKAMREAGVEMRVVKNRLLLLAAEQAQRPELAELREIGELPPREVLIAQVAGALMSPVTHLAGLFNRLLTNPAGILLNDSLRTFSGLLEARAGQLEGA